LGAAIGVALLFFFAQFAAPDRNLKETHLSCSQSSAVVSFTDMNACTKDPRYRPGCGCGPVKNPWFIAYHLGLIPLLVGLLGYISLSGSLTTRLVFLNGAVAFALVTEFVLAFVKNDSAAIALPFLPFITAGHCAIATAWFFLFRAGCLIVKQRTSE
jgi:hypothetical protein